MAVLPVVPSPQLQPASAPVVQRAWHLKKNARGCEPVQFKPTIVQGSAVLDCGCQTLWHGSPCLPALTSSAIHSHTIAMSGRWPPAAWRCVWGPHWCWTCSQVYIRLGQWPVETTPSVRSQGPPPGLRLLSARATGSAEAPSVSLTAGPGTWQAHVLRTPALVAQVLTARPCTRPRRPPPARVVP